jgi:hypothetical protein
MSPDRWTWECEQVREAVMSVPKRFGLQAYPGKLFQVDLTASYWNGDEVVLYVYVLSDDGLWRSFAKGTKEELLSSITEVPPYDTIKEEK